MTIMIVNGDLETHAITFRTSHTEATKTVTNNSGTFLDYALTPSGTICKANSYTMRGVSVFYGQIMLRVSRT